MLPYDIINDRDLSFIGLSAYNNLRSASVYLERFLLDSYKTCAEDNISSCRPPLSMPNCQLHENIKTNNHPSYHVPEAESQT